jgi:8-amino-7-oxononanoate synthase
MYENALNALHKSGRFRKRDVYNATFGDLASNDYLNLAANKSALRKSCELLERLPYFSPKASQLVNGYHPIHQEFERTLCFKNGFESGMIVGSGFLANLALLEALPRKGDTLLVDEKYHASGIVATKLTQAKVVFFKHNDAQDLQNKLKTVKKRAIIAVEGIYSMDGDIVAKEIFDIADNNEAILIVDEAHSSAVVGKNLLGVYDLYDIKIKPNHIKMGTLGKAYGSYGAYILASAQTISFLENRAKSVIYTTAPSLFDTALAYFNFQYIAQNKKKLKQKIDKRREYFHTDSLIVKYEIKDIQTLLKIGQKIKEQGFIVGTIRPPTVEKPMIRMIANLGVKMKQIKEVAKIIDVEKNI